jgi:ribonuclease Z
VLLDAGEPVAATLARRNYDWSRLAGIVLSHTHADHLGGLPMLMQQIHLSGRGGTLALHAPPEFAAAARAHLAVFYLLPEVMTFDLTVASLAAGEAFELAGCRLMPSATTHLAPAASRVRELGYPNRCEAFAFSVHAEKSRLFYSGDVGRFEDIEALMAGVRFAVVDSTHIDPDAVAAWADRHPETTVVLSHVSPAFDPQRLEALRARYPRASVRLAVEGEVIEC